MIETNNILIKVRMFDVAVHCIGLSRAPQDRFTETAAIEDSLDSQRRKGSRIHVVIKGCVKRFVIASVMRPEYGSSRAQVPCKTDPRGQTMRSKDSVTSGYFATIHIQPKAVIQGK